MNNAGEQRRGHVWRSPPAPPPGAYGFSGDYDMSQKSHFPSNPHSGGRPLQVPDYSGHPMPSAPPSSTKLPTFQQQPLTHSASKPFLIPPSPLLTQQYGHAWSHHPRAFQQTHPHPPPLSPPPLAPLPPFPRHSSLPTANSAQEWRSLAPPLALPHAATSGDPGRPITDPSLDPAVQYLLAEAEHKLRVDFQERRDGAPAGAATEAPWHSRAYLEALEGQVALLEAVIRECSEMEPQIRSSSGGKTGSEEAFRLATEAAQGLEREVKRMLAPLEMALDTKGGSVEVLELAEAVRRRERAARKQRWKRKRRRQATQARDEEGERRKELDEAADEWRAREVAKGIAQRKMREMLQVADKAAQEERKKTEGELEALVMVERVRELRSLRVAKMKRHGHLMPSEDDAFLADVSKAVEAEDRAAAAGEGSEDGGGEGEGRGGEAVVQIVEEREKGDGDGDRGKEKGGGGLVGGRDIQAAYLGPDMYQFYFGSEHSTARLIEVRRQWDSYLSLSGRWVRNTPWCVMWGDRSGVFRRGERGERAVMVVDNAQVVNFLPLEGKRNVGIASHRTQCVDWSGRTGPNSEF